MRKIKEVIKVELDTKEGDFDKQLRKYEFDNPPNTVLCCVCGNDVSTCYYIIIGSKFINNKRYCEDCAKDHPPDAYKIKDVPIEIDLKAINKRLKEITHPELLAWFKFIKENYYVVRSGLYSEMHCKICEERIGDKIEDLYIHFEEKHKEF